ncbi:MAG TPA: nucleotidyltransferase family protein [Bryobacteraceae bacterium]|nr:nucleotidyltransferase family protein [Bryobacteraceae bacterium]
MSIAGIILAAGASSRMGRPKPLLSVGTETFVDRLIRSMSSACSPVIVVLGYSAEEIRSGMKRAGEAEIVMNERCSEGQLSSLQRGIAAIPETAEAVMFTPVDHPHLRTSTFTALAERFKETDAPAIVATHGERRGHPVLVSRAAAGRIAALPPDSRASDVVHGPDTLYVDVDDPGVVEDIDDPETYRRLLEAGTLR